MVQVGDTVWVRAKAGLLLSDDTIWFTDLQGVPIKNTDGQCIPDLPGVDMAALVAFFAGNGVERVVSALDDADDGLRQWRDGLLDNGAPDDIKGSISIESSANILRRLAAALEVK